MLGLNIFCFCMLSSNKDDGWSAERKREGMMEVVTEVLGTFSLLVQSVTLAANR